MSKKVVIVSPHYDDMEFGCGGLVQVLVNDGYEVISAVICHSDTVNRNHTKVIRGEDRHREAQEAASILGIETIECLGKPHNSLYGNDMGTIVSFVEECLRKHSPEILLIPLPSFHQDHQVVFKCCIAATRPTAGWKKLKVMAYEYPMVNWGSAEPHGQIQGAAYLEMTPDMLDIKVRSIQCHLSQIQGREDTITGTEGVKALARLRGLESGFDYAEKHYVIKEYL